MVRTGSSVQFWLWAPVYMLRNFLKLPILKRLIPSVLRRLFKILKLNKKYWKINNLDIFLNFEDTLDRKIILFQKYEENQFNFLANEIEKNKINFFLDIGANSGYYSFFITSRFQNINTISFEPNKIASDKFEKTLEKNTGLSQRISLHKFGLINESGTFKMSAMFKENYLQPGGSTLVNEITKDNPKFKIFNAEFKTLDEVIKTKKSILAIKIDVEGNENLTLLGMTELIKNNKIILQIEIYKKNFELNNNFLLNSGFKNIYKFEDDYFYKNF